MALARSYGFQKGISGNPAGRPKGARGENTKKYGQFRQLVISRYEDAFRMLWNAMEKNEGWAFQLYFKELIPKKYKECTVGVNTEDKSIKGQILALTEALVDFDEVTHNEAMDRLKTLAAVKLSEQVDDNMEARENRAALLAKVDKLDMLIQMKREEKHDE